MSSSNATSTPWSRRLVQETVLTTADLIWPLFVTPGKGVREPVESMPAAESGGTTEPKP